MISAYSPITTDRRLRGFHSESEYSAYAFSRIKYDTASAPYVADVRQKSQLFTAALAGICLVVIEPRVARQASVPLFGTVFTATYDRGGCLLSNDEHSFAVGGTTLVEAESNLKRELLYWREDYQDIPDEQLTDKAKAQRDWINSLSLD